ncbi:hypothetical protein [Paludifilum halophilum]|uniref:Dephospho-CoA kinase n=1 Tax=Paludifilum halophilum TaxID=1642702 RepID=A0A235B8D2_9BACL|nr:hypothetical protein [Paludifilum halophilum]OYD08521.1 hypothetical protein CHM34_06760 [Paludifilum halophilum]
MNFIGLVGEAAVGKDTVARYLKEYYRYRRVAYGDEMKYFYGRQKGIQGNRRQVIKVVNLEKNRQELIDYGTHAWRDINPDIWVYALDQRVKRLARFYKELEEQVLLVATDVRFQNELDLIRDKYRGTIVKVTAPLSVRITRMEARGDRWDPSFMGHESERFAREVAADFVIDNGGALVHTTAQIEEVLNSIKSRPRFPNTKKPPK